MDDDEMTWTGEPAEEDALLDDSSLDDEATADIAILELTTDPETAGGDVEGDVSDDEG